MTKTIALTIGLDVGDRHTHLCGLDESGTVVLQDRFATTDRGLRSVFRKLRCDRVALEVGRHSPWMSRLLAELGHQVIVANPRKVRLIHQNDTKNDRLDAERLARLARVDPELLCPIQHRQEHTQVALAVLRSRELAVCQRTRLINSIRGQVKSLGGRMPAGHIHTFHELLDNVPDGLQVALAPLMELVRGCNEQIRHYDRLVEELASEVFPETEQLRQVWGVGPVTALAFVLTIEHPERFASSRAVGSYFGLRPRQDQSGEVDKHLRITKAGDSLVRKYLVQCSQQILREGSPDSDLKRWGLQLAGRGGAAAKKRAVTAVARKLAVLLHRLWVTGSVYEPLRLATTPTA